MYLLTKLAQNKLFVGIVLSMVFGMILLPSTMVLAQANVEVAKEPGDFDFGLKYGQETGLGTRDIRATVAGIINVALSLLGIVAVVIILIGGFEWMTAGGNEEKTGEAKKRIMAGVIGIAIILSAYALASFILAQLYEGTTGEIYNIENEGTDLGGV